MTTKASEALDYQEIYDKNYYKIFIKVQKTEKKINFTQYLNFILKEKDKVNSVLDIGCGEGGFLEVCNEYKIPKLVGVDISRYAITIAKKNTKAKLLQLNLENQKLPFGDSEFDVIVAMDIIEHLKNTRFLFKELYRVLDKDGLLFLTTENSHSLFDKLFSPFFPHHKEHINLQKESYWIKSLQQAGFRYIKTRGIVLHGFPPLLGFRNWLKRRKVPVVVRPIFSPYHSFSGTLVIFASKKK